MNEREKLLRNIQICNFVLQETALYLDSHPYCRRALRYYQKHRRIREELTEQYEAGYGQLTIYGGTASGSWHWVTEPFPWEV